MGFRDTIRAIFHGQFCTLYGLEACLQAIRFLPQGAPNPLGCSLPNQTSRVLLLFYGRCAMIEALAPSFLQDMAFFLSPCYFVSFLSPFIASDAFFPYHVAN
jgi:hypothetical protein